MKSKYIPIYLSIYLSEQIHIYLSIYLSLSFKSIYAYLSIYIYPLYLFISIYPNYPTDQWWRNNSFCIIYFPLYCIYYRSSYLTSIYTIKNNIFEGVGGSFRLIYNVLNKTKKNKLKLLNKTEYE